MATLTLKDILDGMNIVFVRVIDAPETNQIEQSTRTNSRAFSYEDGEERKESFDKCYSPSKRGVIDGDSVLGLRTDFTDDYISDKDL